jgi:hypothetical protein
MGIKDLFNFMREHLSQVKPTTYASREKATQVSQREFYLICKEVARKCKVEAECSIKGVRGLHQTYLPGNEGMKAS